MSNSPFRLLTSASISPLPSISEFLSQQFAAVLLHSLIAISTSLPSSNQRTSLPTRSTTRCSRCVSSSSPSVSNSLCVSTDTSRCDRPSLRPPIFMNQRNVGLVTSSSSAAWNASAIPFTIVVLPAPRFPRRRTIFGGASNDASSRPSAIVSSADFVVNSRSSGCGCIKCSIAGRAFAVLATTEQSS